MLLEWKKEKGENGTASSRESIFRKGRLQFGGERVRTLIRLADVRSNGVPYRLAYGEEK